MIGEFVGKVDDRDVVGRFLFLHGKVLIYEFAGKKPSVERYIYTLFLRASN